MPFLTAIMPLLQGFLQLIPNPEDRAKKLMEILSTLQAADAAQNSVNAAEATHRSIFVAGWRPFIGWVCGTALAYQFVILPLLLAVAGFAHWEIPPLPKLDDMLWQILAGMLGLGTLRTAEKMAKVTK